MLSLLLSAVTLGAYGIVTFRRALAQKLTIITDIVGRNCQVALTFNNPGDAKEFLAALQAEPAVGRRGLRPERAALCVLQSPHHVGAMAPSSAVTEGRYFEGGSLIVCRPIVLDQDHLGTVYIRSGLDELFERMRVFGIVLLAILTGCGLLRFRRVGAPAALDHHACP